MNDSPRNTYRETKRLARGASRKRFAPPPSGDVVAVAGALSGLIADTLLHPFDTLSTRLKVRPGGQIRWKTDLLPRNLLGGIGATVWCSLPSSGLYFWSYETSKTWLSKRYAYDPRTETAVHLASGALAELLTCVVHVPFEVVKVRLQVRPNRYSSSLSGLREIYRSEGIRNGLYRGFVPCVVLDTTFGAIQFASYEFLVKLLRVRRQRVSAQDELLAGTVSGAIGAVITNPVDVLVSRRMNSSTPSSVQKLFLRPTDFYRGTIARVLSIAPLTGITFAAYEFFKRALVQKS